MFGKLELFDMLFHKQKNLQCLHTLRHTVDFELVRNIEVVGS